MENDNSIKMMADILNKLPPGPAMPLLEPESKCACGKTVSISYF